MDSITAPDDLTVVIKLKTPRAWLFSVAEMGSLTGAQIVPKELLDKLPDATPVGSGPWQQTDAVPQVSYTYKRFDGYRDAAKGLPWIDEHTVRCLSDPTAIEAAFRGGELDYFGPSVTQAKQLQSDLGNKIAIDRYLGVSMQDMNSNPTRAPWTDARVRQAIYRILDRQQLLDLVYQGDGTLPWGVFAAGLEGWQLTQAETAKYWVHDLQAAKQLLTAAGFDFSKDYSMITNGVAGTQLNQAALVVQQQLKAAGITSHLTVLATPEWFKAVQTTGDFDLNVSGQPAFDCPERPLRYHHTHSGGVVVYGGGRDPNIDAMIDKSEQTADPSARDKLIHDIQIALLDFYSIFIQFPTPYTYFARYNYVRNYELSKVSSAAPAYQTEAWIAPH
jgi:ABC-type transport system substrate-binding protein